MRKGKKENCELEEEKVELLHYHGRADSIATPTPVDTDEVKPLIKADKCGSIDGTLTNNNNSGLGDSVRYLDSVLENASKIRVFVGLDDDSEIPPVPTSNPVALGNVHSNDLADKKNIPIAEIVPIEYPAAESQQIMGTVPDDTIKLFQKIAPDSGNSTPKDIQLDDDMKNIPSPDDKGFIAPCPQRSTNSDDVLDVEDSSVTSNNDLSNSIKENYTVLKKSLDEPNSKTEIKLKDVLAKTYDCNAFQKKFEQEMIKLDDDVDPDTICGVGRFKPKWLQRWATARMYLIFYSLIGTLSGSYYTYLIGVITTLEKRYAFDSKITGTIMMVDEITPLFLGSLVGYFGGKAHRPRMIAFGMLLSSICCFISAAPYFIYGPERHINVLNLNNGTSLELCNGELRDQNCGSDDRPPTLTAILLLMLGSFLKGFGNLAYYAIGMSYMDDVSKKKNAPIYFAITYALRLVGPVIGFLLSSAFLKYPEYPFDNPEYGPEDPRWIGAWWIGFVLQGILLFIFTIPIALFPRRLPGTTGPTTSSVNANGEKQDIVHNIAGLFLALKRLAKNPIFVFYMLACICTEFGVFGHYIMLPKYMEHQFHLSASDASLLSGPPSLCGIILSMLIGGYCIWKFKPNAKVVTGLMAAMQFVGVIGYSLLMIPRCEKVQMMNFGINDNGFILEDMCNTNCNCTTAAFTPVCAPDGKTTYFSPCYAGCSESKNETYFNCSCLADFTTHQADYVTQGFCTDENCWNQALIYAIFLTCMEIIKSSLTVAFTMVLLRSVLPEDKSIALGTFETLICAFTFIPFPLVFGAMADACCLVWEKSCGKTGNCWFYDTDKFNYFLHGTPVAGCFIAMICMTVVSFSSDRLRDLYKEDNEEITNDKEIKKNIKPPTG